LPESPLENGRLRVIAGRHGAQVSPIDRTACDAAVLELRLDAGGTYRWNPPSGHRALVRPYRGRVRLGNAPGPEALLDSGQLAVLDGEGEIVIRAEDASAGTLLLSGRPLGEPIVQYGPFVMNTAEEIRQAIRDYQSGALVAPLH
jgi:quercetin 2,3-dioxygenase